MGRGVLDVYHGPFEATECPHKTRKRNKETREIETVSTWYKYRVEKYAGRIEKCYLCKQKRVLDVESDGPIGWIEQASLFG